MIAAAAFVEAARRAGFALYSGVPCSYFAPLVDHAAAASGVRWVGAANEGEAVAIASGAAIAGVRGVAMFQNSGLGNAVSPLSSLNAVFEIPVLLVVTLRGEPGGPVDEPQHALMGQITTGLLDLLRVAWERFPEEEEAIAPALERAVKHMERTQTPYALVMHKGAVRSVAASASESYPAASVSERSGAAAPLPSFAWPTSTSLLPTRAAALSAIRRAAGPRDVLVATTGYTGRELYALSDRENQLYMVGSMGCASSFALGLALADPSRRVIVVDGDGAALMRLGALAVIGRERPRNLAHVLLDNESHESTGAQPTASSSTDLGAVAHACGYPRVMRAAAPEAIAAALATSAGDLAFVHVKTRLGVAPDLPRPTMAPRDVARRLRAFLEATRAR